jgi:integrase
MRGSVYKRCTCRDANGKKLKGCRKAHGSWTFHVEIQVDPATGKRKQITKGGFRTRSDAEEEMAAVIARLNEGSWTDDKRTTVGEWLDRWLSEVAMQGKSPKTLANYRGHVRDVWKPRIGDIRLRDLRRTHIEDALLSLVQPVDTSKHVGMAGRRVAKRSGVTIDGYRRTIRAALSAALRRGLILTNPATGRIDAIPPKEERDLSIWEPEQTAKFLAHVAGDRLSALYELAAYAGLRRAELCGLRWSDLDPGFAGLKVRQTIVEVASKDIPGEERFCRLCRDEHVGMMFKGPKSKAGRRWIPLAEPAREALRQHHKAQAEERADFGKHYRDHGLVFCMPDGNPLRPGEVTSAFTDHVAACGLPQIRLHDTRHGACSLLIAGGVPIEVVQMILGHSSPAVTRQVYAHLMRGLTAEQVEAAARLLNRYRRPPAI